jgi:hypothetical protein
MLGWLTGFGFWGRLLLSQPGSWSSFFSFWQIFPVQFDYDLLLWQVVMLLWMRSYHVMLFLT